MKLWLCAVVTATAFALRFLAARHVWHRPLNASLVAFSDDGMVNALPLNSLYSVANAVAAARTISQAIPS